MNNKLKNFLIIVILLISVGGVILPDNLNNLDEIWNYNFARCIANGLLPYKDFNIITTPLLPIICGTILRFTFNEIIVMRILAIILMTTCFFMAYKILKKLNVNTNFIFLFLVFIYLVYINDFGIDYNYSVLLIILTTIYCELKKDIFDCSFKYNFGLGLLVGTSILFKQTTGIVLTTIFIFYKLLTCYNKQELKIVLKIIIYRVLGAIIPLIALGFYLIINDIWIDFLNYTVYSINTFSNKVLYTELIIGRYSKIIQILSIILIMVIPVMYYISIYKKHTTQEQKNIFILFAYSIASMAVAYPISDKVHFLIGSLPFQISICYLIYLLINNYCNKRIKTGKTKHMTSIIISEIAIFLIVAITIGNIIEISRFLKNAKNYTNIKHFKYITNTLEDRIKEIDTYIINKDNEGKKVYILDSSAALFMIPLDKYNKDYDLFLKGNIGANGEEGLIQKLEQEDENIIVLLLNAKYKKNWQTPDKVIEYIKNNWEKLGEIDRYDEYIKKDKTNDIYKE